MINARLKSRFFHSDFIRYLLTALILTICSAACSTPPGNFESRDPASKAAIAATVPILQKFYFDQAPIRQASSAYPLVDSLPGGKFKPGFQPHSVAYDSNGTLLLAPGDYVIPVMTYCMDTEGSSPSGAVYRLSELQGTRAELIKKLNQKAFPRFSSHDVQILSWSLQAGLSYEELPEKSQQIFDAVFPERRNDIQESFIKKFRQEWDRISNKANGLFPSFDESSDNVLDHMGEVGLKIRALREFQSDLKQHGDDYSRLSRMIDVSKSIFQASKVTPWSKINDRVYARFVTDGQFQEMGQIQVRVVSTQERGLSSSGSRFVPVNISSWVADPMNFHIQPLSFSTILSAEGILLVPQIAEAPVIAAALLVAVLASDNIDWDSFQQLKNFLVNVKDSQVRDGSANFSVSDRFYLTGVV